MAASGGSSGNGAGSCTNPADWRRVVDLVQDMSVGDQEAVNAYIAHIHKCPWHKTRAFRVMDQVLDRNRQQRG